MKMSKVIKEYIKEKVNEKYPLKENPKPFIMDIIRKEVEEATTEIVRGIFAKYTDKIAFRSYQGNGVYAKVAFEDAVILGDYANKTGSIIDLGYEEAKEYNTAVEKKRAKVFRDIIVQMELGGTKKDLDELLANLPD